MHCQQHIIEMAEYSSQIFLVRLKTSTVKPIHNNDDMLQRSFDEDAGNMICNIRTGFRSSKFLATNIYVEALSCVYDVYTTPTLSVGSTHNIFVLEEPFLHKQTWTT